MATSNSATRSRVEVVPSARRLIGSLRDLGYDFVHAIADLVDNSIAANASRVVIDLKWSGPDSWVRVIGQRDWHVRDRRSQRPCGLVPNGIIEVDDLGKFGLRPENGLALAMPDASLLRAALIETNGVSRFAGGTSITWRNRINGKSKFLVSTKDPDTLVERLLQEHTGTVVLWESLERVLKYKVAWGENSKNALYRLAEQLDQHLGMVFHRFLSGEARRRKKLTITVNGNRCANPGTRMRSGEKATEVFPPKEFELHSRRWKGYLVRYQPYRSPRQRKSSPVFRPFERMSGPEKWNRQQGFYIYRADRMIQSGGWSRMRTADEHTKLAGAAIDFYPDSGSGVRGECC